MGDSFFVLFCLPLWGRCRPQAAEEVTAVSLINELPAMRKYGNLFSHGFAVPASPKGKPFLHSSQKATAAAAATLRESTS